MVDKVLISGSGSGLGRAMAIYYADQGAEVCISDINEDAGQQVAQQICDAGGKAFFIHCDITKQWDVDILAL